MSINAKGHESALKQQTDTSNMKQYIIKLAAVAMLGLSVMAAQANAANVAVRVKNDKVSVVVKDKAKGKKKVDVRKNDRDCRECRREERRHEARFNKKHHRKDNRRDKRVVHCKKCHH